MFCRKIIMCSNVVRKCYSLSKPFLTPFQQSQSLRLHHLANSSLSLCLPIRNYHLTSYALSNSSFTIPQGGLTTRKNVEEFLSRLSEDEKTVLFQNLRLESPIRKAEYDLWLEHHHYLTKFGRPSTHPITTASLDDELSPAATSTKTSDAKVTGADLWAVGFKNALPFVGFGFLDNLIMILAGDYIDMTIGTALGISTMAAAALGNTVSDVAGIASAWYVEVFSEKVGIREPQLTSAQYNTWQVRWSTTSGRAIGVVIGCLLGMIPLLFLPSSESREKDKLNKSEKHLEQVPPATITAGKQ